MDTDDSYPTLDRRTLLRTGAAGALVGALGLAGGALAPDDGDAAVSLADACILTPETTEGPFYVDLERIRNDIKEAKQGLRLRLRTTVVDSRTCKALPNAAVDIWHCDAVGVYSGFAQESTEGETYLRGVQITDRKGVAVFETIYPGWYPGRATHIHLKVHVGGSRSGTTYAGGHVSHTGQLFFPDRVTDQVTRRSPYTRHTGSRTRNATDSIFATAGGARAIVKLAPLVAGAPAKGYLATIVLAVDPTATPAGIGP